MDEETTSTTSNGDFAGNGAGMLQGKKRILPFLIVAAVALIALAVGIGIYNTPANRLQRQLELGNRYLEEQQYEEAIVAFEKAISIDDRCLEAYVGGIKAYQGLGDTEGMIVFYERALAVVDGMEESELAENMDAAVTIYLMAADVYSDDIEKAIEILERGYDKTGDQRIRDKIAELMKRFPVELISQLPATEYEGFVRANDGIILAYKDGLLGAINAENEIVVPFEYDTWRSMDDNGNLVLVKSSDDGLRTYVVFDANGNMVQESDYDTIVSNGMYIQNCYEGDGVDSTIDYYNMDGTLVASLPYYNELTGNSDDDWVLLVHGFYDEISLTDIIDGNVGEVNGTGNVQWSGVKDWSVGYVWEDSSVVGNRIITARGTHPAYTPLNSMNHGYFVSRLYLDMGDMALMNENYEIVAEFDPYLVQADEEKGFIPEFSHRADFKVDNGFQGFYHDGDYYYNYGTNMVWALGGKDVLVDFSLYPNMTVDTMDNSIVKAIYDRISMSDADYWLVLDDEQWGYIDHDGNKLAMFDDGTDFYGHYAVVVENGVAYVVNEEFEKIQELGEAESVYCLGDLFCVESADITYFYRLR